MRGRLFGCVAALSALALSVLPGFGGQHFGIKSGDILTLGSVGASYAGPTPCMDNVVCISGVVAVGLMADVVDGGSGGAPAASVATLDACLEVQTVNGTDFGCIRDVRVPSSIDPLMETMRVSVTMPSQRFPRTVIQATLLFRANGMAAPAVDETTTPPNYPDFFVAVSAGLARPGMVEGQAVSEGLGAGGPIAPTGGRLVRGASVLACSYQGVAC